MKKIDYTFAESILEPFNITVEEIANANGYQTQVPNPNFVPAQGPEEIVDPAWEMPAGFDEVIDRPPMVPNPDHVPAVGQPTMPNPDTPLAFVAQQIPKLGMVKMIENVMSPKIRKAERDLIELRKQPEIIASQIVEQLQKSITE